MSRGSPVVVETVWGKPIPVLDRTITPVVRRISSTRHRATIKKEFVEGEARGVVLISPVAVVEERYSQVRVLDIPDVTRRVLVSMALIATLLPLLSLALVRVNLWMRGR